MEQEVDRRIGVASAVFKIQDSRFKTTLLIPRDYRSVVVKKELSSTRTFFRPTSNIRYQSRTCLGDSAPTLRKIQRSTDA